MVFQRRDALFPQMSLLTMCLTHGSLSHSLFQLLAEASPGEPGPSSPLLQDLDSLGTLGIHPTACTSLLLPLTPSCPSRGKRGQLLIPRSWRGSRLVLTFSRTFCKCGLLPHLEPDARSQAAQRQTGAGAARDKGAARSSQRTYFLPLPLCAAWPAPQSLSLGRAPGRAPGGREEGRRVAGPRDAPGRQLPRRVRGEGGRALHAPSLGRFLSHKRRQRARQPCPAPAPAAAAQPRAPSSPPCRPAPRRPPPAPAPPPLPPPRPPGSPRCGEGEGGGPGVAAEPEARGASRLGPLSPRSARRDAEQGAVRPSPRLTSRAADAGRSDVRFPVRLSPDPAASGHRPGERRAASAAPSPDPLPPPRLAAGSPGSPRGQGRAASAAGPGALAVGPPCTCWASALWRVCCSPLRCSWVLGGRLPPPPSSRDSASPTRSRTQARPRWVRARALRVRPRGPRGAAGLGVLRAPRTCAEGGIVFHLVCIGSKMS